MAGFTYTKKEVKNTASDIYYDCYAILYHSHSNKGQEILVSILSQKLAIKTVERIILANPHSNPLNTSGFSTMRFWQDVKKYLTDKILSNG
jgi:hypothetical protein